MNDLFKVPGKWTEDIFGWVFVAATVVAGLVGLFAGSAFWAMLIVLAALGSFEERAMRKRGVVWPSNWLAVVFPVYLWKRLNALKMPKHMLGVWAAAFLVVLFVLAPLFTSISPEDLMGLWVIDAESSAEAILDAKGVNSTQREGAMPVLTEQLEGIAFEFTPDTMNSISPMIPVPVPIAYKITGNGRSYIDITNEQGNKFKLVFSGKKYMEMINKASKIGMIFRKR